MSVSARREKLDPKAALSIRQHCALLSLNRSTAYYELCTARPIYGSRKMTERLRERGHEVNRKLCSG